MAEYNDIQPGQFYYHFKRDKSQGIEHGAYYILGLGMNTENRSQKSVICKPLYYCNPRHTDEIGISYQIRPIEFFIGVVDRENYKGQRFTVISDMEVIEKLKQTELYNSKFLDN